MKPQTLAFGSSHVFGWLALSLALLLSIAVAAPASPSRTVSTPPLTLSFERQPRAEAPPYVLKITNAAGKTLQTRGHVLLSVAAHNQDRVRRLPEQALPPGQTLTVDQLAAHDRVVLQCEGYAALEVVVPETQP